MNSLPTSIESYFKEAGFSGTEILIVKKLIEGDAMTLRDLAFKTGKSTGVLDQAMKKLLKKRIVDREMINGTPKYVLHSLDSVSKWLQEDMRQKKSVLELRHQNFESFIASVTSGKKRPEMQFFEGDEGLKKAFMLLLEKGNDFVQYGPTLFTEVEDPLRDFNVQYFRERRKRNIFLRVITHNTPLGRRFQNRDPFEYRKTVLVDEQAYPFSFEKIIVGNTVACFQHEKKEACFIEYQELAERERHFFERLWNMKLQNPDQAPSVDQNPLPFVPEPPVVPQATQILSRVREFFLSPSSIVAFVICSLFATGLTYFLYLQNLKINLNLVQERAKSIAATGALQFEAKELEQLQSLEDINKPLYSSTINLLNKIRNANVNVKFAYLMRPTSNRDTWEFIADADSIDPFEKKDLNNDGIINIADELSPPGALYIVSNDNNENMKALISPYVWPPYADQWGTIITAWAPLPSEDINSKAILGIDISSDETNQLARKSFAAIYYFIFLLLAFLFVRLAAFNLQIKEFYKLVIGLQK